MLGITSAEIIDENLELESDNVPWDIARNYDFNNDSLFLPVIPNLPVTKEHSDYYDPSRSTFSDVSKRIYKTLPSSNSDDPNLGYRLVILKDEVVVPVADSAAVDDLITNAKDYTADSNWDDIDKNWDELDFEW